MGDRRPATAVAILLALVLGVIIAGKIDRISLVHAEDMDIAQKIANAKTAADHEELADYFANQASEARKRAELHRKMADSYKKTGGAAASKWHLPAHCDGLVKMNDSAAKDYSALADAHRAMAKSAK